MSETGPQAAGVGARGVVLLVLAVGMGVLLLQAFDRGSVPFTQGTSGTRVTLPDDTLPLPVIQTTTTAAPRAPGDVTVLAANGTGTVGLAGRIATFLNGSGYTKQLTPSDAQQLVEQSRVEHKAGYAQEARQVVQLLGLPAAAAREVSEFTPVRGDSASANIVVQIGPDLDRALAGGTTTTTR